jgi:hypothetical protein
MELIEEQWNRPPPPDITSDSWIDITDAKNAVKTWILDRAESWAPSPHNDKRRLQLHCLSKSCSFYIRVAQKKESLFGITSYTLHDCPPTHAKFKQQNSAWYLAILVERDITINRRIKPKEIGERAGTYHQLKRVPYMSAWRARECLRDILDGDEGASFKLIPPWIDRISQDTTAGIYASCTVSAMRFEAVFIMLGSIRSTLGTLRPFYALDGTHTRSRYNLTLLLAVGIDAKDRVLPLAFALVPGENEKWWSWFCEHLALAFESDLLPEYVIISDRDKGLLNAVESKLPGAHHAMCCQHIAENIHKKFGRDYKPLFWQIARAQSQSAFNTAVQALQRDPPQVEEYLRSIGYKNFAFACFPLPRFGHDTSNIVESVNSAWREIRELPPLQLLNGIYQWTLTTFHQRLRVSQDSGNTVLSNTAYQAYKHRESAARGFRVLPSSDTTFLITTSRGIDHVVHLPPSENTLLQGPAHVASIKSIDHLVLMLLPVSSTLARIHIVTSLYITLGRSQNAHIKRPLQPITLQGLLPLPEHQLLPPIKKAKRGRPKVARIRTNYKVDKQDISLFCVSTTWT